MRKQLFGVAVMAAALALTGCTAAAHQVVPVTPSRTAVPQQSAPDLSATFYAVIDGDQYFVGIEGTASEAAQRFCELAGKVGFKDAFESGASQAVAAGVPAYDYGYLVGAAVGVYCPEFKQDQQQYMGSTGS